MSSHCKVCYTVHFYTSLVVFAGKYCGKAKPRPLVTLTNRLTLYFNTNERTQDKGFKAHYKAVAPERTSGKKSTNPYQQESCMDSGIMLDVYFIVYE